MKAICPISGIPFRTYDSLPIQWAVEHPIFSIPFDQLVIFLDTIREQEESLITNWDTESIKQRKDVIEAATIKDLTTAANLAIHEKNWKNPAFRLYQTKHLVMLALMRSAQLLELDKGYAARPKPEIIESQFWIASELFIWANTISNPALRNSIPKYKISQYNERMDNLKEYLEEVGQIKSGIGNLYRSVSTEHKLAVWEQAIAIINRRREVLKTSLSSTTNPIVAKWALTITNTPSDIWDFWYAILSSTSIKITFDGVKVNNKWESVTGGDLRELHDWLDDRLFRPKGEPGEYHRDDTEFYFMARQTALEIVRNHIRVLEQGTSSYKIINAALGDNIISANDDDLNRQAIASGMEEMPKLQTFPKRIEYLKAMAVWRTKTKNTLLEKLETQQVSETTSSADNKTAKAEKIKYQIL